MKKLLCLLLALLLVLCGCGKEEPATEPEPTEPPTRPVVEVELETQAAMKYEGVQLQYWSLLAEDAPEAQVLRQAVAYYAAATGAQVEIQYLAGDEEQLAQALTGDLQADIFETSGQNLANHLSAFALDLTELAAAAQYDANSWPVLREQTINRSNKLLGIPYRPYLYGLYYNRDGFDALGITTMPQTWAEYLTFCQMLKDNGYEALVMDQERAHLILELHMERALGWEGLKETMVNAQWRSNEMAMTMIQEAIGFAEAGYLVKGNPAVYPAGQNRLGQSNALLVAGSNVLCHEVEEDCLTAIRWGIFAYPGDGPGKGLLVDADLLAVNASCQNVQAAFDFVMLLTTGEFDQLRADVTLGIPADPHNESPIYGAAEAMKNAESQAPRWFPAENQELFSRLWNGYYKTGAYFAYQLNNLSYQFANEKSVG